MAHPQCLIYTAESGFTEAMNLLVCDLPDIKVTKPKGLSSHLFFQAINGPNAIAFAQLSSRTQNKHRRVHSLSGGKAQNVPGVSYCLKIIEVSHQYRNMGVGSALLDEVIRFCMDERVTSIYGEAKGDIKALRHWYQEKGFDMDSVDNIQLPLTA